MRANRVKSYLTASDTFDTEDLIAMVDAHEGTGRNSGRVLRVDFNPRTGQRFALPRAA